MTVPADGGERPRIRGVLPGYMREAGYPLDDTHPAYNHGVPARGLLHGLLARQWQVKQGWVERGRRTPPREDVWKVENFEALQKEGETSVGSAEFFFPFQPSHLKRSFNLVTMLFCCPIGACPWNFEFVFITDTCIYLCLISYVCLNSHALSIKAM